MNAEQIKELTFRIQKVAHAVSLEHGLLIQDDRLRVEVADHAGAIIIRGIMEIACKDEQVYDIPVDWWAYFKIRWFPKWLLKRRPAKMKRIWIAHTFPEINLPQDWWGQQYAQVRILDPDRLEESIEEARKARTWKETLLN